MAPKLALCTLTIAPYRAGTSLALMKLARAQSRSGQGGSTHHGCSQMESGAGQSSLWRVANFFISAAAASSGDGSLVSFCLTWQCDAVFIVDLLTHPVRMKAY